MNHVATIKWMMFIVLSWFVLAFSLTYAQEVTAVRTSSSLDTVKIVIELSKNTQYKTFSLRNPDRLVVDIENGSLASQLPADHELISQTKGFVHAIRSAQYDKNTYRVVLELKDEIRVATTMLSPSAESSMYRLVLDLKMLNAPVFTNTLPVVSQQPAVAPTPVPVTQGESNYQFDIGKKLIVAIDAGHGGKDPGALGKNRTQEKDVVLQIAKKLADRINRHPRMKAVLTRTGDYYVGLHTRTKIARDAGADVFVSVHADAVARRTAKGSSVYVLSNKRASSEFAKLLADKENASFAGGALDNKDEDVKQVLLDLSKDYVLHESLLMAGDVLTRLKNIGPVHSARIERAGFAVLKSLDIPSILIETAFISNPTEESKLKSPGFQNQLSEEIYNGLVNYANRGAFEQIARRSQ